MLCSLKEISYPLKLNRASGIQHLWGLGHKCLSQSFGHIWISFWTSCAGLRKRTVSQGSQRIMFHQSSWWLISIKTEWEQVASHKRKTCLHSISWRKARMRLCLFQKGPWTSISAVVSLCTWPALWCCSSLLLVSCIHSTLSEHSAESAQGCVLVWVICFYSTSVYCETVSEDSLDWPAEKATLGAKNTGSRGENNKKNPRAWGEMHCVWLCSKPILQVQNLFIYVEEAFFEIWLLIPSQHKNF